MSHSTVPRTQQVSIGQGKSTSADLVPISEAKNNLSQLVERVRGRERVVITRNDRPAAMLLSIEEYNEMAASIPDPLGEIENRFAGLLSAIASAETVAAGTALFKANSNDLGRAAHNAIKGRGIRG